MIRVSANYLEVLSEWRRDFHRYPEPGWLEFRTTSKIADLLETWGYSVYVGKELITGERMGLPNQESIMSFFEQAKNLGANEKWLAKMAGGYTGALAILDTGKPGPNVLFRVDIDALPILESTNESHVPQQLDFRSLNEGYMHACGHDSHAAIGLGLAEHIMQHRDRLQGTIKILFQPAEEGVRGAASLVSSNFFNNIDYFFALHIGTGVEQGVFVAGTDGFLATSKYDVIFKGIASHAGAFPEQGKNALLASAQATLALHALPPHSDGSSRINVGMLNAGAGRNIIAPNARMQLELRGETTEINAFYESQMRNILEGIATMYDIEVHYEKVGSAISVPSNRQLAEQLAKVAKALNIPTLEYQYFNAGSEDATYLMEKVQSSGGLATYSIIGTDLAAGHHNECFDIREKDMLPAIGIWLNMLFHLSEE
ncbi:amidohydrolase [Metasolibacillus meyeri]|uniref:Amidohydrolase n=1 Tax=Metasolibacillus meyeri TaxID=1071052 RepID=A0AAW9NSG8_9BACL|nr:amidohydrolase [Metasolibacillus meyeri]MEC1180727.1 amidohydrolase [Metasolibacillus meyeri]